MTPTIEELARGLTEGAAKALLAMTDQWQFGGNKTFNANGAYALYWGRMSSCKGLFCDRELQRDGKWKRWAYRLTPLGLTLRAYLEKTHG